MAQKDVKLSWKDGKIKHVTTVEDIDITPKDLLDAVKQAEGQLVQMEEQKVQLEQNLNGLTRNLISIRTFIRERDEFKDKCKELQLIQLKELIEKVTQECKVKAVKTTDETIAKDPNAYTRDQKKNMRYVNYQRFLAIHNLIANKIAAEMVQLHIFEKPVFKNPFED